MSAKLFKTIAALTPVSIRQIAARWYPLRPRSLSPYVTDLRRHTIQEYVRLETYWLSEPIGPGPAASFYIFDDEVLRFDCFGGTKGHFHINRKQARAFPGSGDSPLYFPPGTTTGHIDQACFELYVNLPYCLRTNASRRIRNMRIQKDRLKEAAEIMKAEMLVLAERKG